MLQLMALWGGDGSKNGGIIIWCSSPIKPAVSSKIVALHACPAEKLVPRQCCCCRQLFLKRWHDAVERMLQQGRAAARQVEEQLWLQHKMSVRVTPSLAIYDVKGRPVVPADVGIVLPQI